MSLTIKSPPDSFMLSAENVTRKNYSFHEENPDMEYGVSNILPLNTTSDNENFL